MEYCKEYVDFVGSRIIALPLPGAAIGASMGYYSTGLAVGTFHGGVVGFFGVGMYATTYYSSVYALKKAFKEKEDVVSHHIVSGALTTALFSSTIGKSKYRILIGGLAGCAIGLVGYYGSGLAAAVARDSWIRHRADIVQNSTFKVISMKRPKFIREHELAELQKLSKEDFQAAMQAGRTFTESERPPGARKDDAKPSSDKQ